MKGSCLAFVSDQGRTLQFICMSEFGWLCDSPRFVGISAIAEPNPFGYIFVFQYSAALGSALLLTLERIAKSSFKVTIELVVTHSSDCDMPEFTSEIQQVN
jgi:hypothetical protein